MGHQRRLKQARSLGDVCDLLDTLLCPIVEVEIALQRILNLVARVDMKFAAVFASARDERHGVAGQPQLLRPLVCLRQLPHDAFEIDIRHLERWNGEQHGAPFIPEIGPPACRHGAFLSRDCPWLPTGCKYLRFSGPSARSTRGADGSGALGTPIGCRAADLAISLASKISRRSAKCGTRPPQAARAGAATGFPRSWGRGCATPCGTRRACRPR